MDDDELLRSIQHQLEIEGSRFSIDEIHDAIKSLDSLSEDLIATNLPDCIYRNSSCKSEFEDLFRSYDSTCRFAYLPSFSRAKVMMNSFEAALTARYHLDKRKIMSHRISQNTVSDGDVMKPVSEMVNGESTSTASGGELPDFPRENDSEVQIGCYFSQKPEYVLSNLGLKSSTSALLEPPLPDKQFLISPPASPPVGWKPKEESEPIINYDLLAALSKLAPGEQHELQPSLDNKPSIVLTPCQEEEDDEMEWRPKTKIVQTRCPERR